MEMLNNYLLMEVNGFEMISSISMYIEYLKALF